MVPVVNPRGKIQLPIQAKADNGLPKEPRSYVSSEPTCSTLFGHVLVLEGNLSPNFSSRHLRCRVAFLAFSAEDVSANGRCEFAEGREATFQIVLYMSREHGWDTPAASLQHIVSIYSLGLFLRLTLFVQVSLVRKRWVLLAHRTDNPPNPKYIYIDIHIYIYTYIIYTYIIYTYIYIYMFC